MPSLPRIALGTVQPEADTQAVSWGLMDLLTRAGVSVQHFRSRACFSPVDGATATTGAESRHLDNWLMSPDVCREIFSRGAGASDLALVEGRWHAARRHGEGPGGDLDELSDWLDLPRLAVIDVSRLRCGHMTPLARIDAILLDHVQNEAEFHRLATILESLWNVPVLGGMAELPAVRAAVERLPPGSELPRELCAAFGDSLERHLPLCGNLLPRLRALADRREFPAVRPDVFRERCRLQGARVALAFDSAFRCYFPDVLDLFELLGAVVSDFSPLRDERLPPDTDVVYIGCGHPERHAAALSANHCMTLALRNHVCAGRRIYAEGGGLAYLCQHIETTAPSSNVARRHAMAGVFPAVARLNPEPSPPAAIEVTLAGSNWLGTTGARLRGYLNTCWNIEPVGPLVPHVSNAGHEWDLVGRHHAIGSRLHLNFAAQPRFLRSFLKPHAPSLELARAPRTGQLAGPDAASSTGP